MRRRSCQTLLPPTRRTSIHSLSSSPSHGQFRLVASRPHSSSASAQNLLAQYSQSPTRAIGISELMQYGAPPLSEEELLLSAERTRVDLLGGLARRVTAHLSLPFLPATNPSLQTIYELYSSAFKSLAAVPEVKTLDDNDKLCQAMSQMVYQHRDNIPILAKGFQESRKYLSDSVITSFLDRAIRNRITLRLQAEQHLSLSSASLPALHHITPPSSHSSNSHEDPRLDPSSRSPAFPAPGPSRIGVLDLALSPAELIDACGHFVSELCEATYGVAPAFKIEGSGARAKVKMIGGHLEYIMTELLKNAFRATVEYHTPKEEVKDSSVFRFQDLPSAHMNKEDFPPVIITLASTPGVLTIRIRDRGGGIAPENIKNVFSYAFTTVPPLPDPDSDPDSPGSDLYGGANGAGYYGGVGGGPEGGDTSLKTGLGTLAGLGFGLPLSRIYAEYWGGSLDVCSMYGWGSDLYICIRTD